MPELFPILRSIVDEKGRNGQILLLGSASPELLRQGSETLAGIRNSGRDLFIEHLRELKLI